MEEFYLLNGNYRLLRHSANAVSYFLSFCKVILILLVGQPQSLFSQGLMDSVHNLPLIEIHGNRLDDFSTGLKIDHLDSLSIALSSNSKLSELLDKGSSLYTKNYGAGNLATLGIRGTSSSQSGLYWNGFDMKPPGAGMIDISLIPVVFFNKLDIQYGGSAALFGNGNMGGALHLGNTSLLGRDNELSAAYSAGSFDETQQQLIWKCKNPFWGISTAIAHYNIVNDYPFTFNEESFKRQHAGISQFAFMQNFEGQWGRNHLDAGLWLQSSDRDIPPSITSADLNSHRTDKSFRFTSRWRKASGKGQLTAGIAVFHDYLRYREIPGDTLVLLDSRILNTAIMAEGAFNKEIVSTHTLLSAGVNAGFNTIDINTFGGINNQKQAGVYLLLSQPFYKRLWRVNLSMRQEIADDYSIPFVPALSVEGKLIKRLSMRMQVASNYRIPAMNDRFWVPGGNADLKPESGFNLGGGLVWNTFQTPHARLKLSGDVFYTDITNWISWIPSASGYFIAKNVQEVILRGVELAADFEGSIADVKIHILNSYSFVAAINQKKLNAYDLSEGKQLMYTPGHRFFTSVQLSWHKLILAFNQSYTGRSYTNRENTEYVNSFSVANCQLRYLFLTSNRYKWVLQSDVINIWDVNYEVVKYFPMPGRTIRVGMNLVLNYNKKTKE